MRWREHPLYSELLYLTNNDYFPRWHEDSKHVDEIQEIISEIDEDEYETIRKERTKRRPKIVLYLIKKPSGEEQICFSAREAAAYLGVTDNTIRIFSKEGIGKKSPFYGWEVRKLGGSNV